MFMTTPLLSLPPSHVKVMSLVGLSCLMVSSNGGSISLAALRGATHPIQRGSDFINIKVLVEHLEGVNIGQREWLSLNDFSCYSALYVEDQLVWARRVLPNENNNPVAWPAKAYSLLCGGAGVNGSTILVEYFCDLERAYLQLADTKQLNLIEAKGTLSQHSQMLQELTEWEKKQQNRNALTIGGSLTGQRVRICSIQQHLSWITGTVTRHNLQTRELTVEDVHRQIHVINPFLTEVILMALPQQQQVSGGWYSSNTDIHHPYYNGPHSIATGGPHLATGGPHLATGGPVTHNLSLMQSEPNLHISAYDHQLTAPTHHHYTPTGSYSNLAAVGSPLPSLTPHDGFTLLDPMYRHERSKSLGNLHLLGPPTAQQQSRRRSHAVPLSTGNTNGGQSGLKRTRFAENTLLPTLPQIEEHQSCDLDFPPNRTLSRSLSQPALFTLKPKGPTNSSTINTSINDSEEDDLDIIQSIISRETSITSSPPPSSNHLIHSQMMRSQSLSHIPREMGSLPSLHHATSMHVLHENYMSTPDVTMGLGSPPPYQQITDTHSLVPHPPNEYQPKPHPPNEYPSKPHPFDDPVLIPSPLSLTPIAPPTNELLRQQATPQPVHIASSPQAVSPLSELEDNEQLMNNDTEINIDCIVNQHMGEEEMITSLPVCLPNTSCNDFLSDVSRRSSSGGEKARISNREVVISLGGAQGKRGRGRPRLSDDEKQRRKELREMGLIKRSKRRTKEEVLQWKADKVRTPAKRGRKPGTGKKNMIKGVTGKIILVTVDLSKYDNGTVFFQNGFCQAYSGVSRCIECAGVAGDYPSSRYCRFLEFRKLRVVDREDRSVYVEGFATFSDAKTEDLVPWTPLKTGYSGMDPHTAVYVLSKTVKYFISILSEEARTITDTDIFPIWKCAVKGVRELCDICDTTVFNLHWVCQHCGFSICPACYQLSCGSHDGSEAMSSWQTPWPVCSYNSLPHTPYQLTLTQIIPGNVLSDVLYQLFHICHTHNIPLSTPNSIKHLLSLLGKLTTSSVAASDGPVTTGDNNLKYDSMPIVKTIGQPSSSLLEGQQSILELPHSCSNETDEYCIPPNIDAPHLWLCNGEVLYLLDPNHHGNISAFQWAWRRSRPVVVTGIDKLLNSELWTPQSFLKDFGEELADLVDCRTGLIMTQIPCKAFWSGFEDLKSRLQDPVSNCSRLLKLKDWPTGEDFSDKLPHRFNDLMSALPLPDYTRRDGKLNLTASLPNFFVKPDLGPKMYNAYGTSSLGQCGTTNLHLDVSDAVNVLVYTVDTDSPKDKEHLWKTIEQEACSQTLKMVSKNTVGALWHIYSPSDADKLRQFLRKVLEERGMMSSKPGTDPIHDQLIYMDSELRQRLWEEEGVKGWTIPQCKGDGIFIPAGAPHQVQNQSNSIKVAEDFVSPEHVNQCISLTEEFRQLSSYHSNHEDKLQIKNILYHSVKDIVGLLKQHS